MKLKAWAGTDVGLKREINQDSILIDGDLDLFVVADGMGGHKAGEVASALAIKTLQKTIKDNFKKYKDPRELMLYAYTLANQIVYDESHSNPDMTGMATTMVALMRVKEKIYISNVGDSRVYLVNPPCMWQLTEDHSIFNEKVRSGILKEEDRDRFEGKNIITRSVGYEINVNCDIFFKELKFGDQFIICSDGLHGLVNNYEIASICTFAKDEEVVPKLINAAKKNGGDDNVSVIYIRNMTEG